MHLSLDQRGVSNIIFPLVILTAIGLGVYLVQKPTELTPSAQEVVTTAPAGCVKVTPGSRSVRYKNCSSSSQNCGDQTNLLSSDGERDVDPNYQFDGKTVATYALKESVWDFGSGWKNYNTKGPRQEDGDRIDISKGRFDGPNGQSWHETDADEVSGGAWKIKYGDGNVIEYAYSTSGTNFQGLPGSKYDKSRSYAFVPTTANGKCDGTGSTGTGATGAACTTGSQCRSGSCTNQKCDATGTKAGGAACTSGPECQSGTCSNGKCAGGTAATGRACDENRDCASNRCVNNKCESVTASASPARSPSPTPRPSGSANPSPSPSSSVSPAPSASLNPSPSAPGASPSPGASVAPVPVSLTKAEIVGFRNSYNALEARLGTATNSGNLKVVSGIARTELDSIVSQLPTCPDDASVGACVDQKFRTRFDFAKTAARLSAFYGIFNGVSGICVKSDFGLNPLITATSQNNLQGRVNLCTEPTAAQKIWRVFVGGKFEQVLSTDTRWPANPTCATLPQDVLTHYRNAETLFNTQAGFTLNTLCDGKTSVIPDDTNDP